MRPQAGFKRFKEALSIMTVSLSSWFPKTPKLIPKSTLKGHRFPGRMQAWRATPERKRESPRVFGRRPIYYTPAPQITAS
jgi:hypothetical protein